MSEEKFEYKEPLFCKNCYTTLTDFIDSGFVGCENCYKIFDAEIKKYVASTQYSSHHTGKIYFNTSKEKQPTLADYELLLRKAITEQRFEDCLVLKNKIQALKEDLK
jgi:protein arginine kinase activator